MYTGLQEIWDYLDLKDSEAKADAIFVLGGSSLSSIYKAQQLYQKGLSEHICFTSIGGTFGGDKIWGMTESKKYQQVFSLFGCSSKGCYH